MSGTYVNLPHMHPVTVDPTTLVLLALGTYVLASYVVAAKVFAPIHRPTTRWLQKREAQALKAAAETDNIATQIRLERKANRAAWIRAGLQCRVCVGQWIAFVAYSWVDGWTPPWEWGTTGWFTAVAINAVHSAFVELAGKATS